VETSTEPLQQVRCRNSAKNELTMNVYQFLPENYIQIDDTGSFSAVMDTQQGVRLSEEKNFKVQVLLRAY
jgi:hypothetical protein